MKYVYAESICYNISFSFCLCLSTQNSEVFQMAIVLNMASPVFTSLLRESEDVVLIILSFKCGLIQNFSRFEAPKVLFVFSLQKKPLKWGRNSKNSSVPDVWLDPASHRPFGIAGHMLIVCSLHQIHSLPFSPALTPCWGGPAAASWDSRFLPERSFCWVSHYGSVVGVGLTTGCEYPLFFVNPAQWEGSCILPVAKSKFLLSSFETNSPY